VELSRNMATKVFDVKPWWNFNRNGEDPQKFIDLEEAKKIKKSIKSRWNPHRNHSENRHVLRSHSRQTAKQVLFKNYAKRNAMCSFQTSKLKRLTCKMRVQELKATRAYRLGKAPACCFQRANPRGKIQHWPARKSFNFAPLNRPQGQKLHSRAVTRYGAQAVWIGSSEIFNGSVR